MNELLLKIELNEERQRLLQTQMIVLQYQRKELEAEIKEIETEK